MLHVAYYAVSPQITVEIKFCDMGGGETNGV